MAPVTLDMQLKDSLHQVECLDIAILALLTAKQLEDHAEVAKLRVDILAEWAQVARVWTETMSTFERHKLRQQLRRYLSEGGSYDPRPAA